MKNVIVLSFLILTGCVTIPDLKPGAETVRVIGSESEILNCKSLGIVHGYSDNGIQGYGGRGGISQRHSVYDAQNKAYEKGADILLIVSTNTRLGGTDTTGEAFECE